MGEYAQELTRALVAVAPDNRYLLLAAIGAPNPVRSNVGSVEYARTRATPHNAFRRDIWENVTLPRQLTRWGADLFHSTDLLLPLHRLRSATVVTVHDLTVFTIPEAHNRAIGHRNRFLCKRSAGLADVLIAISNATRKDLIEWLGVQDDRIVVVYNGVDRRFVPNSDLEARRRLRNRGINGPFILSVGTIEPRKNHKRLVEAFNRIAPHFPGLELVLAGRPGWLNREVFESIDASPVRDRIRHLDYVSDADLPELYRLATIMAYPSLYEGFGLPPVEAMACGTAVLTSDRSSLPEIVGDAGLIVDPTSVSAIADGLARMLTTPGLLARLREAGLERAAHFSWDLAARQTMAVYERAVERRLGARGRRGLPSLN